MWLCAFFVASVFVRRSIGRVCLLFSSRDCFLFIYSLFSLSFHFESMNSFDLFHCFAHLHVSSYNCVRIFVLIIRCFVRCCSLCSVTRAKTRRAHTYSLIVLVSIISSVRKTRCNQTEQQMLDFFPYHLCECVHSAQHSANCTHVRTIFLVLIIPFAKENPCSYTEIPNTHK